ncbi:MAG TPA: RsmD family RNA methyltransferase, partial [Rhizomicrobium sp.]|nr:RsmD family RNA methyltransferase [Rhizomicrobium sp.]
LDPPYRKEMIPKALQSLKDGGWLADGALLVAESDGSESFETPGFTLLDERDYGETRVRFLTLS